VDPNTDVEIQRVEFSKEKGLNIVGTAPGIAYLADECTELLKKFKADNYIQFDMMPRYDRGQKPVCVTVAFANGEMPAMRADRLSRIIDGFVSAVNNLEKLRNSRNFDVDVEDLDVCIRELNALCSLAIKRNSTSAKIEAHNWITVEERLPETKERVLAFGKSVYRDSENEFYAARFYNGEFSIPGISGLKITHWQPMPVPPEAEGEVRPA
jgi:hypothetical protein